MRGPIDYIIVGFEGNKFDGSILKALADAIDRGVISVVALSIVSKDAKGVVTTMDAAELGDSYVTEFTQKYVTAKADADKDDVDEVGDLIENNCTAGLLVVEQLWAKPLKKALIDADGVLLGEGRIHPDAAAELDN